MLKYCLFVIAVVLSAPLHAESLLIVGDSLTAGYGVAPEQAWPALLQQRLSASAATRNWTVINAGVSGDTTAGGAARLPALLKRHQPTAVLIALGGNDGLRALPTAGIGRNLERMLAAIVSAKSKPLMAGMLMPASFPEPDREAFAMLYQDTAKRFDAPLYPFLLAGVAADPRLNQADGIHPNAAGHRVLTEHVHGWLAPLLSATTADVAGTLTPH